MYTLYQKKGAVRMPGTAAGPESAGGGALRGRGQDLPLRHAQHDGLHGHGPGMEVYEL